MEITSQHINSAPVTDSDANIETPIGLPPCSPEQVAVIDAIIAGNVVVDSVAGSGKTTTVLYMAHRLPHLSILVLTYNRRLREDVARRVSTLGLANVEAQTYHSFGHRYSSYDCSTDRGLRQIIADEGSLECHTYDIVVVDEAQDMTPLLYQIVRRVAQKDGQPGAHLCVIGDRYQCIYQYNGSDERFITLAQEIFADVAAPLPWTCVRLSTSYRLTRQIAAFVNKCMLGQDRLVAVRDGDKPVSLLFEHKTREGAQNYVLDIILGWLNIAHPEASDDPHSPNYQRKLYTVNDIFILAPSVRTTGDGYVMTVLSNALSARGYAVCVPNDDGARLSDDIVHNKIVFCSFHQSKGLERPCVVVLGFDDNYFKIFNKRADPLVCPNVLYVAATRARERIAFCRVAGVPALRFIPRTEYLQHVTHINRGRPLMPDNSRFDNYKTTRTSVTDLLRHQKNEVMSAAEGHYVVDVIQPPGDLIEMTLKCVTVCNAPGTPAGELENGGGVITEDVSDINGIAAPAFYEWKSTGRIGIADAIGVEVPREVTAPWLLRVATGYQAQGTGLTYKLRQVSQSYDWLSTETLELCAARLATVLVGRCEFEVPYKTTISGHEISGRADIVTADTLWEIKCTTELTVENQVQLVTYAYLDRLANPGTKRRYKLYNVRTDEIQEMLVNTDRAREMLEILLCYKYCERGAPSDAEFLRIVLSGELSLIGDVALCDKCQMLSRANAAAVVHERAQRTAGDVTPPAAEIDPGIRLFTHSID